MCGNQPVIEMELVEVKIENYFTSLITLILSKERDQGHHRHIGLEMVEIGFAV